MKLEKLNLKGKGELLNEFELKEIKGGYYQTSSCSGFDYVCVEQGRTCNGTETCRSLYINGTFECYCSTY